MKIYYHNDLDGELSAFWVLNTFSPEIKKQTKCIKCDYAKNLADLSIVEKNEEVWLLDYSIKPEKFLNLLQITHNITWIDHHISIIKEYADFPFFIKGLRFVGSAACELTWKFLNNSEDIPLFTRWIGDFDIQSERYVESAAFYYGCLAKNSLPSSTFWPQVVANDSFANKILENGKIIIRYRDVQNKRLEQYASFEAKFEGFKCQCLNHCAGNSSNFNLNKYEIGILFTFNGLTYNISLYSHKIDVSKLAMKYGGGGHEAAAGFITKDLSFLTFMK